MFLLEDGEVYTCGLNTKGQLGHDCEGSKPGKSAFYVSPTFEASGLKRLWKLLWVDCFGALTANRSEYDV